MHNSLIDKLNTSRPLGIHRFVGQKHGKTSTGIACMIVIANSKREIERHQLLTVKVQLQSVHFSPVSTKRDDVNNSLTCFAVQKDKFPEAQRCHACQLNYILCIIITF